MELALLFVHNGVKGMTTPIVTACSLTPSLPWCHLKTTHESAFVFSFFALACQRIFFKHIALKVDFFLNGLEILQAGAVKGLNCAITATTALRTANVFYRFLLVVFL